MITSIRLVKPNSAGDVPPQLRAGWAHYLFVVGIALNFDWKQYYTMDLALYRPGYDLVIVDSWHRPANVEWKPATSLEDQLSALETLMPSFPLNQYSRTLEPTFAQSEEKRFLESEYVRLAKIAQQTQPFEAGLHQRILQRIQELEPK
jgi:hypothetical protein